MRINHIELISSSGDTFCTLGFNDPKSLNPYVMKGIVGLDASDILPKFYGLGTETNRKYYNMSLTQRDLVLRIGLNPNFASSETFSDLRDDLYKKIVSTRTGEIQIQFRDGPGLGGIRGYVFGHVSKFEAPLSQEPEVQITVHCINPMIKGDPITIDSPPTAGGVPEGHITIDDDTSTAPHGFNWRVQITEVTTYIALHDHLAYGEWAFSIRPGYIDGDEGFLVNDEVIVTGQPGTLIGTNKEIYLYRASTYIPIAEKVEAGSMWPVMFPKQSVHHGCRSW